MKQTHQFSLLLAAAISLPLPIFCQTLVFKTEFDYSGEVPVIGTDAANLNGADGQVGTFSGTVPIGEGGFGGSELITIGRTTGMTVDTYLRADRGVQNFAFSADFTRPVQLEGTTLSFDFATSRTDGAHGKDNQVVGISANGDEVFHLWISAKSAGADGLRIGYEGAETGGIVWDLPTTLGEDATGDIGFFNGNTDATGVVLPGSIRLTLRNEGFVINFAGGSAGGEGGLTKLYTSEVLAFKGAGTDLARIEFRGEGGANNNLRGGFWLDDLQVHGAIAPDSTGGPRLIHHSFDPVSRETVIRFQSSVGVPYQPFMSEDLVNWQPLEVLVADSSETEFIDAGIPLEAPKRFYQFSIAPLAQ
ncbi:hypothetical protein V2O64_11905 [Verrucomicrobiaceae bacterium 227]